MLKKGYREPLNDTNVWDLDLENRVKSLMNRFYKSWIRSSKTKQKQDHNELEESGSWHYDHGRLEPNTKSRPSYSVSNATKETSALGGAKWTDVNEKTPLLENGIEARTESPKEPGKTNKNPLTWKRNSSIIAALWRSFGLYYSLIGLFELANIALTYMRPILLE